MNLFPHIPEGLLPPGVESRAFIAGGYAACPARATDIDVWVTDATFVPILMHFDVSTHQVAIIPSRYSEPQTINGPEWTPLNEKPVQLRETSATPARMDKIRTRYADMRTNGKIS